MTTGSIKNTLEPVAWLFQIITAAFIVFFLSVHLIIAHLYGLSNISFSAILARLNDPWWKAFYETFIISVAYHGINGLRGIVFDLHIKHKNAWNYFFIVLALVVFGYATFLLFSL